MVNTTPRGLRRAITPLLAAVLALLSITALAGPAQATSYRYWSYWLGATGTWVIADTGPGDQVLVDGDVQGWRFAITADMPTNAPDNAADFTALCPGLAATGSAEGQVRVAVVIDAGFAADAPEGQVPPADTVSCVSVPAGSTGNQALAAAGSVREESGLVCAINGYPQDECGEAIADDAALAAARAAADEAPNPALISTDGTSDTGGGPGSSTGFVAGMVLVAGLIAGAFAIPRLRRRPAVRG